MSRLRWPDSTNSVSEKPGTIQSAKRPVTREPSAISIVTLGPRVGGGPVAGKGQEEDRHEEERETMSWP